MSAVARRIAVDVGPEQVRSVYAQWALGKSSLPLEYRVKFRVDFPSVFHRGRGLSPTVVVIAMEREIDGEWKPAQLDDVERLAIQDDIESDEELNGLDGL